MQVMAATSAWRTITPQHALAWVSTVAHDVFHLPSYLALSARQSGGEPTHFLYETSLGAVYLPLIKRPVGPPAPRAFDLISPYGYPGPLVRPNPGIDPAGLTQQAMAAFAASLGPAGYLSAFIRAHPLLTPHAAGLIAGATEAHAVPTGEVVLVDLHKPEDQLFAELRRNHRQNLNRLAALGFTADHECVRTNAPTFRTLYHATMQRVHAAAYYFFDESFFLDLHRVMNDKLNLIMVRRKNEIAAAGLFLHCGEIAHYYLAGTAPDLLRLAPSKLLVWKGILAAKAAGCRWLNLGGGLGGRRDALHDFKTGFSKLTAPYHTWRLVADSRRYRAAVSRSGCQWSLPHATAAFPATGRRASDQQRSRRAAIARDQP
jgi:hypothetical protein